MHINSMPDLVLRLIFAKLSLDDLFWIGRVCLLWRSYQLDITHKVRSLSLLIGPTDTQTIITKSCFTLKYRDLLLNEDGTRMYPSQYLQKWFHLSIGSNSLDWAAELLCIFPCITQLEIAFKYAGSHADPRHVALSFMVTLLAQWSPVVKSLKIYLQINELINTSLINSIEFAEESSQVVNLLKVINSMQSLEHLTIDTETYFEKFLKKEGLSRHIDLPILGQLREFYFRSSDSFGAECIEKSLKSFALPNDNLKQIGVNFHHSQDLFEYVPQLASKNAHCSTQDNLSPFSNILHQFSSLSSLRFIQHGSNLLNGELNLIASLPQLTHLHYTTLCIPFPPTQVPREQPLQLASVQVLIINTILKSTSDFESNYWAYLFPNVQVIELNFNAYYCPISTSFRSPVISFGTKQEHQKVASTFVQCPKLHHIYTRETIRRISKSYYELKVAEVLVFEWTVFQVHDRKIIINTQQSSNV